MTTSITPYENYYDGKELPFLKFANFSNGCKFFNAQHFLNSWSSGQVYLNKKELSDL